MPGGQKWWVARKRSILLPALRASLRILTQLSVRIRRLYSSGGKPRTAARSVGDVEGAWGGRDRVLPPSQVVANEGRPPWGVAPLVAWRQAAIPG